MNTIDAWASRLREAYEAHAVGADASHDVGHMDRVWRMARRLGMEEGCDLLVLAAGAYLHDVVILPKDSPDRARAAHMAAEKAAAILNDLEYPQEKRAAVLHAIEAHSFSAGVTPRTIEARVLRDADRLESLGAIGIARVFATTGAMGRGFVHAADPHALSRDRDETRYAIDHIDTKFPQLIEGMTTASGRRVAEDRLAYVEAFVARFLDECAGAA